MSFDSWVDVGRQLVRMSRASAWWLGDWLVYGETTYGRRYTIALEVTNFDYQTLRNYAWVARRFPVSRRRDTLSFQHHAEVASLPEPEQELWLQRAERLHWTRNEFRRQLAASRARARSCAPAASVLLRMQVSPDRERRWRQAATAANQDLLEWLVATADDAARFALALGSQFPGGEENGVVPHGPRGPVGRRRRQADGSAVALARTSVEKRSDAGHIGVAVSQP
jgi:hypothetical protein